MWKHLHEISLFIKLFDDNWIPACQSLDCHRYLARVTSNILWAIIIAITQQWHTLHSPTCTTVTHKLGFSSDMSMSAHTLDFTLHLETIQYMDKNNLCSSGESLLTFPIHDTLLDPHVSRQWNIAEQIIIITYAWTIFWIIYLHLYLSFHQEDLSKLSFSKFSHIYQVCSGIVPLRILWHIIYYIINNAESNVSDLPGLQYSFVSY